MWALGTRLKEVCIRKHARRQKTTLKLSRTLLTSVNPMIHVHLREQCITLSIMHNKCILPGPNYLKTPSKCGIFRVVCEAIPRQVNYLIDEAASIGKGANLTISYIHHYFANHGLGKTHAHLHVDNCSVQNKNN